MAKKERRLQDLYTPSAAAAAAAAAAAPAESDAELPPDPKPLGKATVSGKGANRLKYFDKFEFDGIIYDLGDVVMIEPEVASDRPYISILKYITLDSDDNLKVTGLWFYRPEEAKQQSGETWQPADIREIFFSNHLDEVPAGSVKHKCVVHFVPLNKKLPLRKDNPGLIVQRVYDFKLKMLFNIGAKDYEEDMQHEVDVLVQKTKDRLGELQDIEVTDVFLDHGNRNIHAIDVRMNDDTARILEHLVKGKTPRICTNNVVFKKELRENDVEKKSSILSNYKILTGDKLRDKWLEKLMDGIQLVYSSNQAALDTLSKAGERVLWPDAAVQAIAALEMASHEALGSDMPKYNQKMRQLDFNFRKSLRLVGRLLNKELDPAVVVNMTPAELKDGSVEEHTPAPDFEESKTKQMTEARCTHCSQKKVFIDNIIHTCREDRYQLRCEQCGNSWYASQEVVLASTNDIPEKDVGNMSK